MGRESEYQYKTTVAEEACAIWNMAWQVSLATFCRLAIGTISTAFLGHLGKNEMAAAALGGIWIGSTQVVIYGFAVSLCTLCGQAYGAKNFELCGIWLQLGVIFLTIFSIPISWSFFYVESGLQYLTTDPEVLKLAGTFARYSALTVWPQCVYCAVRQYLQAQEIVYPATLVAATSVVVSLASNYVFIYGCFGWNGLGFIGSPIAQFVSFSYQLIALVGYAFWYKGYHKKTWYGWTWECLRHDRITRFVNLATGMSINFALDEWVYSAVTAIAGLLGTVEIAANSVLFNIWGLLFAVFWGFGLPTQVRCANNLGANDPTAAKRTMVIGFTLGGIAALVAAIGVVIFARTIASGFSSDPEIIDLLQASMPVFCVAVFVSSLHMILAAVVEAMGKAFTLVLVTGICSWLVLLPCSYLFDVFFHLGLDGLWWGSVVGEGCKFLAILFVLCRVDWDKVAADAYATSSGPLTEKEMSESVMQHATDLADSTPTMTVPSPMLAVTPKLTRTPRRDYADEEAPLLDRRESF